MSADHDVNLLRNASIEWVENGRLVLQLSNGDRLILAQDVYDELCDGEYSNRQHYSRATYAKGCRGPMCRLAETHRGRKRNADRAHEGGREYREGFRTNDRSVELAPIITWHLATRGRKIRES
jgi:hypothetical protein